MLGLINDCAEQLVITKFGLDAWHTIKESAGCSIKDHGFEQHGHYPDSATVDIVVAAAKLLNVTVDDVLELFGQFFLQYTIDKGYDNLLRCQGSTLRLWLSNLNAMHDHLQSAMPSGSFPVFWCENCESTPGSIILHYYSTRGALLAGVVVGITKEVAKTYFDVEVTMIQLATQGVENSQCTTWRITSVDPEKKYKLTDQHLGGGDDVSIVQESLNRRKARRPTLQHGNRTVAGGGGRRGSADTSGSGGGSTMGSAVSFDPFYLPIDYSSTANSSSQDNNNVTSMMKCPFSSSFGSSEAQQPQQQQQSEELKSKLISHHESIENLAKMAEEHKEKEKNSMSQQRRGSDIPIGSSGVSGSGGERRLSAVSSSEKKHHHRYSGNVTRGRRSSMDKKVNGSYVPSEYEHGLSASRVRKIFPYHVMVDIDFKIVQVGDALPDILLRDYDELIGQHVNEVLNINRPILAGFSWPALQRLADQKFFLSPTGFYDDKTGARIEACDIKLKGNMVNLSKKGGAMFILSPDAENITELNQMGLTMSDLPLHSFQRDVVFLGEHIASEVRTAHKLDRLSKRLEKEKNLSNTLLNSMLPKTVVDTMREGKTVDPLLYENVTLFFSDVVGFTKICDAVEPWDVIDMLNQLYTVMDHLAAHFNLYKVETVGDGYMACSGMPTPDDEHAQNIANFAIAVAECVPSLVESPVDGKPLQVRIGIHTGHCMGGVVGTLTPHYCLFGDMINTTSRHESTSVAGKIQCSSVLYEHLAEYSNDELGSRYEFTPRGFVEMKGKSRCYTYWLERGSKHNDKASPDKIKELQEQVKVVLSKKKWKKRKYFNFAAGRRRSSTVDGDDYTLETSVSGGIGAGSTIDESIREGDDTTTLASTKHSSDQRFDGKSAHSSDHDTVSFVELKKTKWSGIEWDAGRSRVKMVAATHGLLSSMLWKSVAERVENKEVLDHELLRYVDCISLLYEDHPFHSWDHACQVVLSATFLIKEYHKTKDEIGGSVDNNPFVRFITVFAALIHDVKHLGMPNATLAEDDHPLSMVYDGSFLERQSIQVGLGIFIEDFPELSTFILQLCPEFLHLVTSAILATDVSSVERQTKIKDRFERVVLRADEDGVSEFEKTQTVVESVLLLADVGHCSQGFNIFLNWNAAFFHENMHNFRKGRGADPRPGWFKGQIGFVEGYIVPLTERCSALVPDCQLTEGARDIVRQWKEQGEAFTQQLIDESNRQDDDGNVETSIKKQKSEELNPTKVNERNLQRAPSKLFRRLFSRISSLTISNNNKSNCVGKEKEDKEQGTTARQSTTDPQRELIVEESEGNSSHGLDSSFVEFLNNGPISEDKIDGNSSGSDIALPDISSRSGNSEE